MLQSIWIPGHRGIYKGSKAPWQVLQPDLGRRELGLPCVMPRLFEAIAGYSNLVQPKNTAKITSAFAKVDFR